MAKPYRKNQPPVITPNTPIILCGLHTTKLRKGGYAPVAMYLVVENNKAVRMTSVIRDSTDKNLTKVLDFLDDVNSDPEEPFVCESTVKDEEAKLKQFWMYRPEAKEVGTHRKGIVVGYHVDYKTNHGRRGSPVITGNVAFLDDKGHTNHIVVQKAKIEPKSAEHLQRMMEKAYSALVDTFKLGGRVRAKIEKLDKRYGKFVLDGFEQPKDFVDKVCDGVIRDLRE